MALDIPLDLVQEALYDRLRAATGFRWYDEVPEVDPQTGQPVEMPYGVLGEFSTVPLGDKTHYGYDVTVTVHLHSARPDSREVRAMARATLAALTTPTGAPLALLPADAWEVYNHAQVSAEDFKDLDGRTRHGVLRFRWSIRQVTQPKVLA